MYLLQTVFTCLSSANYSYARTHSIIFLSQAPADRGPTLTPMPQLIKAYSTGIAQYFTLSLVLLYLCSICQSLQPFIELVSILSFCFSVAVLFLIFFPFHVFLFLVCFTPSPFPVSLSLPFFLFHQ